MARMRRVVLIVLGGVLLVPAGAAGAVRHAAPDGAGTACTEAAPCALYVALQDAPDGSEVVVAPGDYGSLAAPLTEDGQIYGAGLDVHGVAGQPRPRIYSRASYPFAFSGGVRVAHVHVVATGDGGVGQYALAFLSATGNVAEDVVAEARGDTTACAVGGPQTLRNTVCWSRGTSGGVALAAYGALYGPTDATLRNVTAWARNGRGVVAQSAQDRPVALTLRNVIAHGSGGTGRAIQVQQAGGAQAVVDATGSNYPADGVGLSAGGVGPDPATNQAAAPLLVSPSTGDFRQLDGSPTVDAGIDDAANGPFALDGLTPRVLGARTDIGADEQTTTPVVGAATLGPVGPATAVLISSVDPEGLQTTYRFEYGPTATYGATTPDGIVPVGDTPVTVSAALDGLEAQTAYHVRVVATNARGTTLGPDLRFTTTGVGTDAGALPAPGPTLATPPPAAPVPPRTAAPGLSAVALRPARARAGTAVRIRLRLDRDATVRIGLQRLTDGRRKGRRCVAPAKAARKAKRCARAVPVRSITRELTAGAGTVTLPRAFAPRTPGRYRITVQATADGRASRTTMRSLTILAP